MIDRFFGDYFFLSNFFLCTIEYEGIIYPSVEHAYQAAKTLDPETRRQCLTMTAGQAKRWGRSLTLRDDWEQVKIAVMDHLLDIKFTPESELAQKLLATSTHELVEGNTWGDTFWGVCNGKGKNMLGTLLMARRSILVFRYAV